MPAPGDGGVGHSWFVLDLTSEHVEPAVVPVEEAGGGERTFTSQPWIVPFEQNAPATVQLVREVEFRSPATVVAKTDRFVQRVPARLNFTREFEQRVLASRSNAPHLVRLRREDEELLLSL